MRYFPAEVDGIADSRVHALPARGAMDVGRIPKKEGMPHSELVGYEVVDAPHWIVTALLPEVVFVGR